MTILKETTTGELPRLLPPLHFLFLGDSKNLLMKHFGSMLLQLCQQSFSYLQENIDESIFAAHSTALSKYFSDIFFFLGLNAVYNDSQKFMKEAASDAINLVSSVYEQFLKLSICGGWIEDCLTNQILSDFANTTHPKRPYIVYSTSMARNIIKLTHIEPGASLFQTPRLYCLYYSYHTCKIETKRKIFLNEDSLSKTLSQILKNHYTIYKGLVQGTIELTPKIKSSMESYMNESLLCLKFLFFIFTSHEDPLHSLSKLEIKLFLQEFVYLFISLAYLNKLISFPKIEDAENFSESGDYVSEILRIIAKFQVNTRGETQRGKKKLFLPLALFLNELVLNCIDSLNMQKDRFAAADEALRYLFAGYVQKVSGLKDSHFVELIVRMIEHPYFRYTAPAKLNPEEMSLRSALDLHAECQLISLLNTVLSIEKEWVVYFYRYILPNIYNNILSDSEVFAILKLIVCSIFQVVLNNYQFLQALKSNSFDLSKVNEKAVQAFLDQKHITSLLNILLQSYLPLSEKSFSGNLIKSGPEYATTDPLMISVIESCIGAFLRIQSFSKEFAKHSEYFLYFVEISKDFFPCRPFVSDLLSKVLSFLNSNKISNKAKENEYLPLILLKNMNEFTSKILIQWNFLEAEKSILKYHQKQLNSSKAFTLYFTYIRHCFKCTSNPNLLLDLLEFARRLLYDNTESGMKNQVFIGLEVILLESVRLLKESDEVLQEIINLLLKIIFDSPTDYAISNEQILSILLIYLDTLLKEGKESIALNYLENKLLKTVVWSSAENCLIVSRSLALKNLIKLAKRCRQYSSVFEKILSAISAILSFQCNSQSLGYFCSLMCKYEDPQVIKKVVLSISKLVEITSPREIFDLAGDQSSGIGLMPVKELPKIGFGFFCWIRLERVHSYVDGSTNMSIFTLNSDNQYGVTFELRDNFLYYSIFNPKIKAEKNSIVLSVSELEYDKWYFIELYHLNENIPKNLLLYINGKIQKDCQYPYYYSKLKYIYNFLGCSIDTNIIDKEKFVNTFKGQISAVHFIEVQKKTLEQVHKILEAVQKYGEVHEITSWIQLSEGEYQKRDIAQYVTYKQMKELNTIFICASPNLCHAKCAKNQVEVLCGTTQARYLNSAKSVILDRGGIKIFFPLLNHLAKLSSSGSSIADSIINDILLSIFKTFNILLSSNRSRSQIFFEQEENIMAFMYLLEEIVKKVDSIDISIYHEIRDISKTLSKQNEKNMKLFIEHILGNFTIWMYPKNSAELSKELCDILQDTEKVRNKEFMLQIIITAIEDLVCSENDEHPAIKNFQELAKKIVVSDPLICEKLFEYLSFDYFRIKPQYFTLIKFIMEIILYFFNKHRDFFIDKMINSLKEFKENLLIATLFHLLELPSLKGNSFITPLRISELDQIFAIVLYILININWEKARKWIPTDMSSGRGKKFENKNSFISFLSQIINLSSEEKKVKIFLYGIQGLQKGQFLGIRTSLAILCSAIGIPYTNIEDYTMYLDISQSTYNAVGKLNSTLLASFFRHFHVVNEQAQIEIIVNFYDIILATKESILGNCFGDLSHEIGYIIEKTLCTMNSNLDKIISLYSLIVSTAIKKFLILPNFGSIWKYLSLLMCLRKPENVIKILYKILEEILNSKAIHQTYSMIFVLFYISYLIEDFSLINSSFLGEKCFHQVIAMLLLTLHKTRLIYCSLPHECVISSKSSSDKIDYLLECELREGGFVRVILKLLLLSIKKSNNLDPIKLLSFFVLRDKDSLKSVKKICNYMKIKSDVKPIKKPAPYSLISLSLQSSEQSIPSHFSMLDTIKKVPSKQPKNAPSTSKSKKDSPGSHANLPNSPFEQPGFLHIYLISEIIHLLHFECFNITSYQQIIEKEKRTEYYKNFSKKFFEEIPEKTRELVEMLGKILSFEDSEKKFSILEKNLIKWGSLLPSINLPDSRSYGAAYSTLDESEFVPSPFPFSFQSIGKEAIFVIKKVITLFTLIEGAIAERSHEKLKALFDNINNDEFIVSSQPYLILISSNMFYQTEKYISQTLLSFSATKILFQSIIENAEEPADRIQYSVTYLSEEKIEKDIVKHHARNMGVDTIKQILKEEKENPYGLLHYKTFDREEESNFLYVKKIYQKILFKCPLYQDIKKQGKEIKNFKNEFITFSLRRDKMGRLQQFHKKNIPFNRIFFRYLRRNFLSKMLLASLSRNLNRSEYYAPERKSKIFNFLLQSVPRRELFIPSVSIQECVLPPSRWFECEIITLKGSVFGILGITHNFLYFSSVTRRNDSKYQRISRLEDIRNKFWCFRLDLSKDVSEIVIKRYIQSRQAVEVYLEDRSIFFNLLSRKKAKVFFEQLKSLHKTVKIVKNPEKFFAVEKYIQKWEKGEITNFYYLLLLNKYGGRSFNDVSQYPVFPWILQEFDSEMLDLSNEKVFRDLKLPTTVLSPPMQEKIDQRLKFVVHDKNVFLCQNGSHYMPSRVVLGYLMLVEPFANKLVEYDKGLDAPERMFHDIKVCWNNICSDTGDNKELIPEFFYCPYIFGNYNNYLFGKSSANKYAKKSKMGLPKVVVDQMLLPVWARDPHHFIQMNVLGLESSHVLGELPHWIDTVFGPKQQDINLHNVFSFYCDEKYVTNNEKNITEESIVQIQEFGTNPIKLFRLPHPHKTKTPTNPPSLYNFCNAPKYILAESRTYDKINAYLLIEKLKKDSKSCYIENQIVTEKQIDIQRKMVLDEEAIVCGNHDGTLLIYNSACSKLKNQIHFSFGVISCVCSDEKEYSYSGGLDGTLIKWRRKPEFQVEAFRAAHAEEIMSMDVCSQTNHLASLSKDRVVFLHSASSLAFILFIQLKEKYNIIRLSFRGYILLASCNEKSENFINVFSTVGEPLKKVNIYDPINVIIFDSLGYSFLAGTKKGRLLNFDLLSLSNNCIQFYRKSTNSKDKAVGAEQYLESSITFLHYDENKNHLAVSLQSSQSYILEISEVLKK